MLLPYPPLPFQMLNVPEIEEQIRNRALVKRIRPEQYFIDFDSLRSGNVTGDL